MATKAAQHITDAARIIGAVTYSPEQWGDRNSDAYAVVLAPHHCMVMVRTDDIAAGRSVTAYRYATPRGVITDAADVMPALMDSDGASTDPIAYGTADIADSDSDDSVLQATTRAIRAAFRA